MLEQELLNLNPLRLVPHQDDTILPSDGFGLVCARAGSGKTALLVQLAIEHMLKGIDVLHIAVDEPLAKVGLWYDELLQELAKNYDHDQLDALWQRILPHRFIHSIGHADLKVGNLAQKLEEFRDQNIFNPRVVLIDGYPGLDTLGQSDDSDEHLNQSLHELKAIAGTHSLQFWFSALTHRHVPDAGHWNSGKLAATQDLFNLVMEMEARDQQVMIRLIKGTAKPNTLTLDPATLLISAAARNSVREAG